MEITYALLWFSAGAMLHMVLSKLTGLCHGILLFKDIEKLASVYATTLVKGTRILLGYRLETLSDSAAFTEEEIKSLKEADDMQIMIFQRLVFVKLLSACPKYYRPYLEYSNWEEMERYAEKIKK